jgi:hypothetical protein
LNLSAKEAKPVVDALIENAARFGGVLTVNWHDRSIAPERLWDDFYIELLADLKEKGAWFPTAAEAVAWFNKRRSAVIESATAEGDTLRVKVTLKKDDLPALRLRAHKVPAAQGYVPQQGASSDSFSEMVFDQTDDLRIAV